MGIKRVVDMDFWVDSKVDDFTPEDKYFMVYLLTNPFSTQLGIYGISIKQAAFQMGYSLDAVKNLIDRFEHKYGMIIYSEETGEIAIKNYLRHSIIKGGKPVEDCILREMAKVKNKELINTVFTSLLRYDDLQPTVKKIITYYLNDNENENENENDCTHHRTQERTQERTPHRTQNKKPPKHKYGEYDNVLLTDEEMNKLENEYPDWLERIERLSSYMASTGKKYKSHYATIRNWARKDAEKQKQEQKGRLGWLDELR